MHKSRSKNGWMQAGSPGGTIRQRQQGVGGGEMKPGSISLSNSFLFLM